MIFRTAIPRSPLNRFVQALVYYEGATPPHTKDRFLPDGNTELLFDLTDGVQYVYDNQTLREVQACRRAWASGVRTRPITIPSGAGSRMLVVAFRRGQAHPFYPLPMSELRDTIVDAEAVLGRGVLDLRERLIAAATVAERFRLVEDYLLGRAAGRLHLEDTSRCIEYAVARITARPNRLAFQNLSDRIGYSQKHFISLFKERVGLPPKQYLRVMRFQKAVLDIEGGRPPDWSRTALECGFYDQAHFIHEFKDLSGFTPGEYLRRKSPLLNYIPVD